MGKYICFNEFIWELKKKKIPTKAFFPRKEKKEKICLVSVPSSMDSECILQLCIPKSGVLNTKSQAELNLILTLQTGYMI
jgi:hypothetical protein